MSTRGVVNMPAYSMQVIDFGACNSMGLFFFTDMSNLDMRQITMKNFCGTVLKCNKLQNNLEELIMTGFLANVFYCPNIKYFYTFIAI